MDERIRVPGARPISRKQSHGPTRQRKDWDDRFWIERIPDYTSMLDQHCTFHSGESYRTNVLKTRARNLFKHPRFDTPPEHSSDKTPNASGLFASLGPESFQLLKDEIESVWKEKQIPEDQQTLFRECVFTLPKVKAAGVMAREIEDLKGNTALVQHALYSIATREQSLATLMEMNEYMSKCEDLDVLKELQQECAELLHAHRILTLAVVESIVKWREQMVYSLLMNSSEQALRKARTIPFMWHQVNYLLKLKDDVSFLGNSAFAYLFNFSDRSDPFLIFTGTYDDSNYVRKTPKKSKLSSPVNLQLPGGKMLIPIPQALIKRIRLAEMVILEEAVNCQGVQGSLSEPASVIIRTERARTGKSQKTGRAISPQLKQIIEDVQGEIIDETVEFLLPRLTTEVWHEKIVEERPKWARDIFENLIHSAVSDLVRDELSAQKAQKARALTAAVADQILTGLVTTCVESQAKTVVSEAVQTEKQEQNFAVVPSVVDSLVDTMAKEVVTEGKNEAISEVVGESLVYLIAAGVAEEAVREVTEELRLAMVEMKRQQEELEKARLEAEKQRLQDLERLKNEQLAAKKLAEDAARLREIEAKRLADERLALDTKRRKELEDDEARKQREQTKTLADAAEAKRVKDLEDAKEAETKRLKELEEAKELRDLEEAKRLRDLQEAKRLRDLEDAKRLRDLEDAKRLKDSEDAKRLKDSEDAKRLKDSEEAKRLKDLEDAKRLKDSEEAKRLKELEDAKRLKDLEDAKKTEEEQRLQAEREAKELEAKRLKDTKPIQSPREDAKPPIVPPLNLEQLRPIADALSETLLNQIVPEVAKSGIEEYKEEVAVLSEEIANNFLTEVVNGDAQMLGKAVVADTESTQAQANEAIASAILHSLIESHIASPGTLPDLVQSEINQSNLAQLQEIEANEDRERLKREEKSKDINELVSAVFEDLVSDWVAEQWLPELAAAQIENEMSLTKKSAMLHPTEVVEMPVDYAVESFTPRIHSPIAYTPRVATPPQEASDHQSEDLRPASSGTASARYDLQFADELLLRKLAQDPNAVLVLDPLEIYEPDIQMVLEQYYKLVPDGVVKTLETPSQLIASMKRGIDGRWMWVKAEGKIIGLVAWYVDHLSKDLRRLTCRHISSLSEALYPRAISISSTELFQSDPCSEIRVSLATDPRKELDSSVKAVFSKLGFKWKAVATNWNLNMKTSIMGKARGEEIAKDQTLANMEIVGSCTVKITEEAVRADKKPTAEMSLIGNKICILQVLAGLITGQDVIVTPRTQNRLQSDLTELLDILQSTALSRFPYMNLSQPSPDTHLSELRVSVRWPCSETRMMDTPSGRFEALRFVSVLSTQDEIFVGTMMDQSQVYLVNTDDRNLCGFFMVAGGLKEELDAEMRHMHTDLFSKVENMFRVSTSQSLESYTQTVPELWVPKFHISVTAKLPWVRGLAIPIDSGDLYVAECTETLVVDSVSEKQGKGQLLLREIKGVQIQEPFVFGEN